MEDGGRNDKRGLSQTETQYARLELGLSRCVAICRHTITIRQLISFDFLILPRGIVTITKGFELSYGIP